MTWMYFTSTHCIRALQDGCLQWEEKCLWDLQPCTVTYHCSIKLGSLVPVAIFTDMILLVFTFEKKTMAPFFFLEQYLSLAVLNQSPWKVINIDFSEFGAGDNCLCIPTTEQGAHVVFCCSCAEVEIL